MKTWMRCLVVIAIVAMPAVTTGQDWTRTSVDERVAKVRELERQIAGNQAEQAQLWAALGQVRVAQGFDAYAVEALSKALAADSTNARAHEELGWIYLRMWRDAGRPAPALEPAVRELRRAFEADPTSTHAAFGLLVAANHYRDRAGAVEIGRRLITAAPNDPYAHLIVGAILYSMRKYDAAASEFLWVKRLKDTELVDAMESTALVRAPSAASDYLALAPPARAASDRIFWASRDPDSATDVNERVLEHYTRVVLADQLFAIPRIHLRGFETGLGELMIRYGQPDAEIRENGSVMPYATQSMSVFSSLPGTRHVEALPDPDPNFDSPSLGRLGDERPGLGPCMLIVFYQLPDTSIVMLLTDRVQVGNYQPTGEQAREHTGIHALEARPEATRVRRRP